MRLNKYLSECGFCSRREADRLITLGRVSVDGIIAELGTQVEESQRVFVDDKEVIRPDGHTYLAFYKPRGVICTFQKKEKNNLGDFLKFDRFITYAGRLDKESEGLLLLCDDGTLSDRLMSAKNGHEKEYVVSVSNGLTSEKIKAMEKGLYLDELKRTTRPCRAFISGKNEFHIILTEGINRQIRRMCKTVSLNVTRLKRIRIENIEIGTLKEGQYRNLTGSEITELKKRIGMQQAYGE